MLTPADEACLNELGLPWSAVQESGWTLLEITGWPFPTGYNLAGGDLLIRIAPGYPDIPLDMWYFSPAVMLVSGGGIPQTEVQEVFKGRPWQRWSRHFPPGDWKPGVDDLRGYLARVRADLRVWVGAQAA